MTGGSQKKDVHRPFVEHLLHERQHGMAAHWVCTREGMSTLSTAVLWSTCARNDGFVRESLLQNEPDETCPPAVFSSSEDEAGNAEAAATKLPIKRAIRPLVLRSTRRSLAGEPHQHKRQRQLLRASLSHQTSSRSTDSWEKLMY